MHFMQPRPRCPSFAYQVCTEYISIKNNMQYIFCIYFHIIRNVLELFCIFTNNNHRKASIC